MAMTYQQWLAANRKPATAASAVEWLRSGQAPAGTVIPEALRPQFGGATMVTGGATSAPSSFDVPLAPGGQARPFDPYLGDPATIAKPPAPLPVPQNPYLPQLTMLLQQAANMGATFNPQRQAAAAATASQLAGSGLVDFGLTPSAPKVIQTPNGPQVSYDYTQAVGQAPNAFGGAPDVTYGVVRGADGRAYLQAYSGIQHAGASRGVFSGSQVDVQQQQARQGLDAQRQAAYTNMQQQQSDVTAREQGALSDIGGKWADYQSNAAQQVPQTVAGWSQPPTAQPSPLTMLTGGQNTVTGAPGGTAKPQASSPTVSWSSFLKSHGGTSTGTLARKWDTRFNQGRRFGGVTTKSTSLAQ